MTTEFVRLDPGMTVADALRHIRAVAREKESIYACYVIRFISGGKPPFLTCSIQRT